MKIPFTYNAKQVLVNVQKVLSLSGIVETEIVSLEHIQTFLDNCVKAAWFAFNLEELDVTECSWKPVSKFKSRRQMSEFSMTLDPSLENIMIPIVNLESQVKDEVTHSNMVYVLSHKIDIIKKMFPDTKVLQSTLIEHTLSLTPTFYIPLRDIPLILSYPILKYYAFKILGEESNEDYNGSKRPIRTTFINHQRLKERSFFLEEFQKNICQYS